MCFKRAGICFVSAAIETGGIVEPSLRVRDISGVEERTCVGWMGDEPRVEFGFGGLPVSFRNSGFGIGNRLYGG